MILSCCPQYGSSPIKYNFAQLYSNILTIYQSANPVLNEKSTNTTLKRNETRPTYLHFIMPRGVGTYYKRQPTALPTLALQDYRAATES